MGDDPMPTNEWSDVIQEVWQIVRLDTPFAQNFGPRTIDPLAAILADAGAEAIPQDDFLDVAKVNFTLRARLSPILTGVDEGLAARAACWIVNRWGGIWAGRASIPLWSQRLGAYDDRTISDFIRKMGTKRISSWSKLLAFARPEAHAVYDSRTAVALNCALSQIGDPRCFCMPESRNQYIAPARSFLRKQNAQHNREYSNYIELLKSVVDSNISNNLLAAEMELFANAPNVADNLFNQL